MKDRGFWALLDENMKIRGRKEGLRKMGVIGMIKDDPLLGMPAVWDIENVHRSLAGW